MYGDVVLDTTTDSHMNTEDIPIPEDTNCLFGLSFVFTGELSSLSRDEAIGLAKRYGGCGGLNIHCETI